jgi:hypothetical protein
MKKIFAAVIIFFTGMMISGCSSSQDYNPSMDYDPGWNMDTKTSFDDIPRHKNHLEHGIE